MPSTGVPDSTAPRTRAISVRSNAWSTGVASLTGSPPHSSGATSQPPGTISPSMPPRISAASPAVGSACGVITTGVAPEPSIAARYLS